MAGITIPASTTSSCRNWAPQPPFAIVNTATTVLNSPTQQLTLASGLTNTSGKSVTNTYAVPLNYRNSYAQTWNILLQRDLPKRWVGEISYTGTKGTRLDIQESPNQAPLGSALTAEQRLPIANAGNFIFDDPVGKFYLSRSAGPTDPPLPARHLDQSVLHFLEIDRRHRAGAEFLRSGRRARIIGQRSSPLADRELGAGIAGRRHQRILVAPRISRQGAQGLDPLGQRHRADRRSAHGDRRRQSRWHRVARPALCQRHRLAARFRNRLFQSGRVLGPSGGHLWQRRTRHHHRSGNLRAEFVAGPQHQSALRAAAPGNPHRFDQHLESRESSAD